VADPDPLSCVLHDSSQYVIPVYAAIQATQDKQYCIKNHQYINLRVEHTTMAMATARWAVACDLDMTTMATTMAADEDDNEVDGGR
jgi:hypothetical protein